MMPLLVVSDIYTNYGASRALFGLSLDVGPKECVCLLGRNGMGKTTTMRSVMGLTPPNSGQIVWRGEDITGWKANRVARAGVGFVPEDRRLFGDLTVAENLAVGATACPRAGSWDLDAVFSLFPKLKTLLDRRSRFLSGGEQQMLTIARTLMGNPDLLLLDEPSEGLAPIVVDQLAECIQTLKSQGISVLLAEQGLDFCLEVADRVYVLEKGQVCFAGLTGELKEDPFLRHHLLGL